MLIIAAQLLAGLVLLVFGAEWLVRGAARLASSFGVAPLIVGLTVVAFGTSAPELAVSVQAAYSGSADIALGNVVGSNICNVLLILGLAAIVAPLVVHRQLVILDVPLMIGISVLVLVLGLDGRIGRGDGVLLFVGLIGYVSFLLIKSRRSGGEIPEELKDAIGEEGAKPAPVWKDLLLIVLGLAALVGGSNLFVSGAVTIATLLGWSELVIGLTVIAIGTSLPEIATSVMAVIRGQRDIAVGNAVGSNIFNLLSVLGIASIVAPDGISVPPDAINFDLPVMIAVAVACLPIFFSGHRIDRWEGGLFFAYYVIYTAYLILRSTQHELLGAFSTTLAWIVLPLTAATLLAIGLNAWRVQRR